MTPGGIRVTNAPWRPGDVMHTQADISNAKEDLGYVPLVNFWDGLEQTKKWWGPSVVNTVEQSEDK